jgi:hypothetical protein
MGRGLIALALACLLPAGALAQGGFCARADQFPAEELAHPLIRELMLSTKAEIEEFFGIRFAAFCMDEVDYGAYYSVNRNTLVVGLEFFEDIANPPGNINQAVAVIAHETAHAFQHQHGLLNMLVETNPHRVKCIELHADFLAGGYMGWRADRYNVAVNDLSSFFYQLGDTQTSADGHHGLGAERFLSFSRGFGLGSEDVITLSSMGIAYVSQANCDE